MYIYEGNGPVASVPSQMRRCNTSCQVVAYLPVGIGPSLGGGRVRGDAVLDVSVDRADGVKHGVVDSADGPVYCFTRRAQGGRVVNGVIGAIDQGGWIERRRRLELTGRHVASRS